MSLSLSFRRESVVLLSGTPARLPEFHGKRLLRIALIKQRMDRGRPWIPAGALLGSTPPHRHVKTRVKGSQAEEVGDIHWSDVPITSSILRAKKHAEISGLENLIPETPAGSIRMSGYTKGEASRSARLCTQSSCFVCFHLNHVGR
jgi:hypothetical protein